MTDITVAELAKRIRVPVDKLLDQLKAAGVACDQGADTLTQKQRDLLLAKLRPAKKTTERAPLKAVAPAALQSKKEVHHGDTVVTVVTKRRKRVAVTSEDAAVAPQSPQPTASPQASASGSAVRDSKQAIPASATASLAAVNPIAQALQAAERPPEAVAEEQAQEQQESAPEATVAVAAQTTPPKETSHREVERKPAEKSRKQDRDLRKSVSRKKKRRTSDEGAAFTGFVQPEASDDVPEEARYGEAKATKPAYRHIKKHVFEKPVAPRVYEVHVPASITVGALAQAMSLKSSLLIKQLMKMGVMATINQALDQDTALLLVEELGHKGAPMEETSELIERDDAGEALASRPPIVTIMGHVDHGKTSLLDYIRRTKVADREAGGITQHIGAYHVNVPEKGVVTFLDTPGHAAFTAMRARGADLTDLVVLVVAADDGVKNQTVEAIQHAKAAQVPLIVAVNKIDKEDADLERVRSELSQHEVISEEWGGDTQFVLVSAKTGQGIDDLLEAILLQAEMADFKARATGPADAVVVESRLDRGRGSVVTLLVTSGVLKQGDILVAGNEMGRVRAMLDENGRTVETAGPSIPVEVLGLSGAPQAGDVAQVVPHERQARGIIERRLEKQHLEKQARQAASQMDMFMERLKEGKMQTLNVVIKSDVQGSLEAIEHLLGQLAHNDVRVNIMSKGVGAITESDIHLAIAAQAMVLGFNVRADATARTLAQREHIRLNYYSVIYELADDVKNMLTGLLAPQYQQKIVGLAQVRDVFHSSKWGAIAGCMVTEGTVKRSRPIRILRDNIVVFEGELESLRRHKDDVSEVRQGMECGIGIKSHNDIKVGDQIEVFERVKLDVTFEDGRA